MYDIKTFETFYLQIFLKFAYTQKSITASELSETTYKEIMYISEPLWSVTLGFVRKYILKADYPTWGSEFDIFSSWTGRCLK